jgi:hypothetical protein
MPDNETADDRNRRQALEAQQKQSAEAKQRVTEEAEALKGNVDRLHNFVQGTGSAALSEHHQGLLRAQLAAMKSYFQILQTRLKDWDK